MVCDEEESICLTEDMGLELVISSIILMGCENAEMRFRVIGGCRGSKKRGLQRGQVDTEMTCWVTKRAENKKIGYDLHR